VQQIFQTLIAQNGLERILTIDVMASMNDLLDQGIGELGNKQAEAESNIKSVNKVLKKFTFKKADNPISAMLNNDIKKHNASIAQIKNETSIAKRTFELLKDYAFDADEGVIYQKFSPGNYTVNFKGFATGTGSTS
jgi:hypothetical protein